MKGKISVILFCISLLHAQLSVRGEEFKTGFIRERGVYALAAGTQFNVTTAKDGVLTYEFKWQTQHGHEAITAPDKGFFVRSGWFAYVESPTRVWMYDGHRQLDIQTKEGNHKSRYSVANKAIFTQCPSAVWAALPEEARAHFQKVVEK